MLVELMLPDESPQERVIKVMDWRFSSAFRHEYHCKTWTQERQEAFLSLSQQEVADFITWLSTPSSTSSLRHYLIAKFCENGLLPETPSNLDIFEYGMTAGPRFIEQLISGEVLHLRPTPAYQELFLQQRQLLSLAKEHEIATIVNHQLPERMPQTHRIWTVETDNDNDSEPSSESSRFNIQALMMEVVSGSSFNFFESPNITHEAAAQFLFDLQTFHVELWRHGIQIMDSNIHNVVVTLDDTEIVDFRMVDFGALERIRPHSKMITYTLPGPSKTKIQVAPRAVDKYFEHYAESRFLRSFACYFAQQHTDMKQLALELLTNCFQNEFDTERDRFVWHFVMQRIIRGWKDTEESVVIEDIEEEKKEDDEEEDDDEEQEEDQETPDVRSKPHARNPPFRHRILVLVLDRDGK